MSQTTIARAANDPDLQARIQACIYDQAFNNADVSDSLFARSVRNGAANFGPGYWAVATATHAAYEAGVLNGRGSPGHDVDVISDNDILAAVQAHWPPDPPPGSPL